MKRLSEARRRRSPWRPGAQGLRRWLALATGAAALPLAAAQPADPTSLSLEQLLEVKVVGASKYEQKQSEVAAAVSVITRQEIRAFGWRSLAEALASLPGVYRSYDRQYEYIGTRGLGVPGDFNTRVLLTIDGNRVNDAVFDQAYTGRDFPLDLDLIERIEFIAGPGGAVYGQNAMFAVINVVTRQGASLGGAELAVADEQPQATRQGRVSWGRKLDNGVDLLLSASGLNSRGQDLALDFGAAGISGVARGLDGERDWQLFASASAGPWAFEFSYGDRLKNDPLGTYESDPLTPGQYQRDRLLLSQLRWHGERLDGALALSARVFVGGEDYSAPFTYSGDPTLQTATSAWHGTELQALYTGWAGHKLMAGIEYQVNSHQDQTFVDAQAPANDVSIPVSGWRSGVYAQDEWSITPTLAATLGLRYDNNNTERHAFSPRVGLAWQADADTTWKALFGRAYRAPNVFESNFSYLSQAPNPGLRVESIDTLELVLDRRVGRDLALRASAYRWLLRDLITQGTEPGGTLPQYQNGPGTTAQGLELSARQGFASGASLRTSLSFQDARGSNGGALTNSPRWLAKLNLTGPLPASDLKASAELQYTSARLTLDGSTLPGAWLANAGLLADKWVEGLELSLYVNNVFGSRAAQPGSPNNWQNAIAQDGRSLRAKFVYRF